MKPINREELLGACGDAIRIMRYVSEEMKDAGLLHYSILLQKAERNLSEKVLYYFEDTEPLPLDEE